MKVEFITTANPLYAAELTLRYQVLRAPLNMRRDQTKLPFEKDSLHLIAKNGQEIIGCVLFKPEGKTGKLYQMAVSQEYQKNGVGRKLANSLEMHLRNNNFEELYLHARKIAIPFYQKLGYQKIGEEFTEVGLPHYKMTKQLS